MPNKVRFISIFFQNQLEIFFIYQWKTELKINKLSINYQQKNCIKGYWLYLWPLKRTFQTVRHFPIPVVTKDIVFQKKMSQVFFSPI